MAARKKKTATSRKTATRKKKSGFPSREAGGVLALGLTVFLGLSLFSWQEPVPGILGIGDALGENLAGPVGALAAGGLLGLLGLAAWVLPPLLFLVAIRLFRKNPGPWGVARLLGLPVLVVLTAPLMTLAQLPFPTHIPPITGDLAHGGCVHNYFAYTRYRSDFQSHNVRGGCHGFTQFLDRKPGLGAQRLRPIR